MPDYCIISLQKNFLEVTLLVTLYCTNFCVGTKLKKFNFLLEPQQYTLLLMPTSSCTINPGGTT